MKIIAFNGPPGSGKSFGAEIIRKNAVLPVYSGEIVRPLRNMIGTLIGKSWLEIEPIKDKAIFPDYDGEDGLTYRELMINISDGMKVWFGEDIWIRLFLNRLKARDLAYASQCIVTISDLGFQNEVDLISKWVEPENFHLIRLRREDCSFEGDSRDYVNPVDENTFDELYNYGDESYNGNLLEILAETEQLETLGA